MIAVLVGRPGPPGLPLTNRPFGSRHCRRAIPLFYRLNGAGSLSEIDRYEMWTKFGHESRDEWFMEVLGKRWATTIQKACLRSPTEERSSGQESALPGE